MPKTTNRKRARKRLIIRKTKRYSREGILAVWRALLFVGMILLLLFCIAWLMFIRTFNAQHLSEMITQQLQQKLNRPVRISSLELKFFNMVELKGFSVLDTYGEPGQAFLSADSVTLGFDLLPLLEHRFIIREVTLNAPRFNLVRSQEGLYNIPRVQLSKADKSTYTHSSGHRFEVSIEDWSIKNGVLSFKDLQSGASHALYGIHAHFDDLRFDELSAFDLNMVLRNQWQDKISEVDITAEGKINFANFNWRRFALRNLKAQVYLFKQPINLELNLDNMVEPIFNLAAQIPAFSSQNISLFGVDRVTFSVPDVSLLAQGTLKDNYKQLTLSALTAQVGDLDLSATATANFADKPISWDIHFDTNKFSLFEKDKIVPLLKRYRLKGRAQASGQLTHTGKGYQIPLLSVWADRLSGDFYGFKVDNVGGEFQAKNNFTDLYARTQTGQVTVARSTFDKLQLSGSWRKGNLYANIASTHLNGRPFKMNLSVKNLKNANRKIHTNLRFDQFDPMAFIEVVKDFVTVITPLTGSGESIPEVTGELAWLRNFRDRLPNFMPNFSGTLSADQFSSAVLSANNFFAVFDLTGLQAQAKELSGPIALKLEKGVIHQMEKLAAEQEALNVTFQPFIMMHRMERAGSFSVGKVLRDVEVNELAAEVNFTNGVMQIDNAYTVGPTISAQVSGQTDWVKEMFDLTIYTMFTNTSKSGVLAENLTDESGNPALAFRVSQSMTKPKLEMLRAKKAGKTIRAAQEKQLTTDFSEAVKFIQGEYHATK